MLEQKYPPQHKEYQEQANRLVHSLTQLFRTSDWELFAKSPCLCYRKSRGGSSIITKGEHIINYNIEKITDFLSAPGSYKKLNTRVLREEELVKYNGSYKIFFAEVNAPFPVSNRQFVNIETIYRPNPKTVFIAVQSCNYDYPLRNGNVRAENRISGFILEKITDTQTKITVIMDTDAKGNIPDFVQNILAKEGAYLAGQIQDIMKKWGY